MKKYLPHKLELIYVFPCYHSYQLVPTPVGMNGNKYNTYI